MTYDRKLKYAYLGADVKGYNGAIVVVLDLHSPRAPTEVARWWLPGQGPGERFAYDPLWTGIAGDFRTHHPIVGADGNFYIGYWNGGFVIAKANWNNTRTGLPKGTAGPRELGHDDQIPDTRCCPSTTRSGGGTSPS